MLCILERAGLACIETFANQTLPSNCEGDESERDTALGLSDLLFLPSTSGTSVLDHQDEKWCCSSLAERGAPSVYSLYSLQSTYMDEFRMNHKQRSNYHRKKISTFVRRTGERGRPALPKVEPMPKSRKYSIIPDGPHQ